MERNLEGKTALVTGASRGIGLAIARRFVAAGASVMLTARGRDALESAAATIQQDGGTVAWQPADAGDPHQARECVGATVRRFGRIDILVNNAATSPTRGPLVDVDYDLAIRTVQVNQIGPLMWTAASWHSSMRERGGSVVNIASLGGLTVYPHSGWYGATKAAIIRLTHQLAYELAPAVRVNTVAPGVVQTGFGKANEQEYGLRTAAQSGRKSTAEVAELLPMKRIGVPDDIASAVLFLASDAASWITGQTLVVDGGATSLPWTGA